MSEDCIFCAIASHTIPADIVWEDDDCIAFHDIQPKAPVHILVIPKRHIDSVHTLTDTDQALAGKLTLTARQVAEQAGLGATGYRLVINCGTDGGQVIGHLHLHVLGGRKLTLQP